MGEKSVEAEEVLRCKVLYNRQEELADDLISGESLVLVMIM